MELKTLDKIFTPEQVESVSKDIMIETGQKMKDLIGDEIYSFINSYLYEHYDNVKNDIIKDLAKDLAGRFVESPNDLIFDNLRKKIWEENKEEIRQSLTDDIITDNVKSIILKHVNRDYFLDWQWKDGIIEIILKNWDKFKNDERFESSFKLEIDRQRNEIDMLKAIVNKLQNNF